jgi:hypothetical protein
MRFRNDPAIHVAALVVICRSQEARRLTGTKDLLVPRTAIRSASTTTHDLMWMVSASTLRDAGRMRVLP